jgi:AbrB family looped-hinge helix DNA binding protein
MRTTIDRAGRLVIPRPLREAIGMVDGGPVDIVEIDGRIVISPQPVAKRLVERDGVVVCVPDEPVPVLTAEAVRDMLESTRR